MRWPIEHPQCRSRNAAPDSTPSDLHRRSRRHGELRSKECSGDAQHLKPVTSSPTLAFGATLHSRSGLALYLENVFCPIYPSANFMLGSNVGTDLRHCVPSSRTALPGRRPRKPAATSFRRWPIGRTPTPGSTPRWERGVDRIRDALRGLLGGVPNWCARTVSLARIP